MSRIRTVKPEYWTSEQVISCSLPARLLFVGLWNFCDDNGVHPASYMRLKAEIFPIDNFSLEDIKSWVNELITNNLLREYTVDEKSYWIVTGWKNHQKIDKPTYRHPLPQSQLKLVSDSSAINKRIGNDNSTSALQPVTDHSTSYPRIVNDSSSTESNGMESKGKEKDICKAGALLVSGNKNSASAEVQEIFQHWQRVMGHPHAKLDSKRINKINQALKLGYSVGDLKKAVDGCASTSFNMGENERKQRYDDITLIFRDAEHTERFIQASSCLLNAHKSNSDIFAGAI